VIDRCKAQLIRLVQKRNVAVLKFKSVMRGHGREKGDDVVDLMNSNQKGQSCLDPIVLAPSQYLRRSVVFMLRLQ
jgi:hypothetical protein